MKDAYLIIANRNPHQLQTLITMLDDSRNDIYIMIDKKSSSEFSEKYYTNYSTLNFVKPIKIYWGGYSQISAELRLFKASAPGHYNYYHLLSGIDLPLVNQDKMHNFFDVHRHLEFIAYSGVHTRKALSQRIKPHLFRKHYRSNKIFGLYHQIERKILYTNFIHEPIPLKKISFASNWVTIDDELAQDLVADADNIYHLYKRGQCVDEIFIPIFINYHPKFKRRIFYDKPMYNNPTDFQGNLSYIDWWDGHPYVWRLKDYNTLSKVRSRGYFYSRKFDSHIDNAIIKKLFNYVMKS